MEIQNLGQFSLSRDPVDIKSKAHVPAPISIDRTDNRDYATRDNILDMRHYEERLKTYVNWPVSFLKPETLANNGFYYLKRGDEVRCAFCKVEIMRWEPGDDPAADHKKWAPQCPFLRQQASGSSLVSPSFLDGRDECGTRGPSTSEVTLPGPANPKYSNVQSRLSSFKDWPLSMRQKPKELSEAGFFYTGQGDKTKCFYCDGGLKDWEDDDDPWEQHARWFNRCAYIQLVKGKTYVQDVVADSGMVRASDNEKAKPKEEQSKEEKPTEEHPKEEQPKVKTEPEKENTVDDEKLCKICFEDERNVCFVPCGHVVACAKCALSTDKCPMCRRTFVNAVRIYFS